MAKTKSEIIELLSKRGLLKVNRDGCEIEYIDGNKVFYDDSFHNRKNVYGVYHNVQNDKYVFFITGEERGGMVDYYSKYDTEEEAYNAMYEYIDLLSK